MTITIRPDVRPDHAAPNATSDRAHADAAAVPVSLSDRLSIVSDAAHVGSHGCQQAAPLAPAAGQYRFRMRQHGRPRTCYAADADALLRVLITDYPDPAEASVDAQLTALQARVRHACGVIFSLFAAAVIADDLSRTEEAILLASTAHSEKQPSITNEQCRRWTHPIHPMVLIRELYLPGDAVRPPGGNIYWIRTATAESYVQCLAALGQIVLQENPVFTRLPSTRITGTTRPDIGGVGGDDLADVADVGGGTVVAAGGGDRG